jgi:type I restriction enzyme S subunit
MAMYGKGKTRGQIAELKIEAATNQACATITPLCSETYNVHFVKYCIRKFYDELRSQAQGSQQLNLNLTILSEFELPLPPLAEQHRIVAAVESTFAVIDEIERDKTDLAATVAAAKSKILSLAIRGKLVPQDPADEPASVLLERIRAERETLVKAGKIKRDKGKNAAAGSVDNSYYENLPTGWAVARLGEIFLVNPRNYANDDVLASFVPMTLVDEGFVNSFSFQERPWGAIKSGFTHFQDGDVGLAKISPCLENRKSVVFSGLVNGIGAGTTELHIFRPLLSGEILSEYLLWFFKGEDFISSCVGAFSGSVGQQRVGKDHIANMLIPLPPIAEQQRILEAIQRVFECLTAIAENLN